MDAFDIVSQEYASTIQQEMPTTSLSKRKRPATGGSHSTHVTPAALHSVASLNLTPKTKRSIAKHKRSAMHLAKSNCELPTASLSASGGADEAIHRLSTNRSTPHRRKNSVVQDIGVPQPIRDDASRDGLGRAENHSLRAVAASNSDRHFSSEIPVPNAVGGDDGALFSEVAPAATSPVIAEIIQLWRMRQRWHRAEKSLILQGRALCRAWTRGDKEEANCLFDAAAAGKSVDPLVLAALTPFLPAIERFSAERIAIEKRLRKLSRSLPIWPWVAEVKGFGDLNLAAIVGEAGEIGGYRNPSCLWKRMGLAVIDGGRQRRVTGEAALAHGYSPARRCVAYLLGDTLIKAGESNRYRAVYTARRARTAETHADWTKAHSHNDGARCMVKRVLRDLWVAWRAVERGHASGEHQTLLASLDRQQEAA